MLENCITRVSLSRQKIIQCCPFLATNKLGDFKNILFVFAVMGLALWVRLAIAPINAGLQYLTFFPAVTLAAIIGGFSAGMLATILGLILANNFFTPPYNFLAIYPL